MSKAVVCSKGDLKRSNSQIRIKKKMIKKFIMETIIMMILIKIWKQDIIADREYR